MPSLSHEALVALFREHPELATDLVRRSGEVRLPDYDALEVKAGELTELVPTEFRADVVVLLKKERPVYCLVVEVQLRRDETKPFAWPCYVTNARARFRCPCCLVVYAPKKGIARWAAQAIELGQPNSEFRPLVLSTDVVARVERLDEAARAPYGAVLSALAHGNEPGGEAIAVAALRALEGLSADERATLQHVLWDALSAAMRRQVEAIMQIPGFPEKSEWFQKGRKEGRKEGIEEGRQEGIEQGLEQGLEQGRLAEARSALSRVLKARWGKVSRVHAKAIANCNDLATLERWHDEAVVAESDKALSLK